MADERRIVIELKLGSGSSTTSSNDEDEEMSLTDMLKIAQHPIKALEKATLGKSAVVYYAYQQAKQIVKATALYQLERYYNLTENYKAEQDLNNTLSVLERSVEGYTSIIGGAIIGAKAGPWGALAGAVVGAASWATNTVFSAWKAFDQQSIQLATMNIQSSYQKVRLGLIDDGRGTQN